MVLYLTFMRFLTQRFRRSGLLAITVLAAILITACSTQKDSFVNRTYHTVNAKYNGYFNARESYKDGINRLSELHNDNYEQILSIFRYGTEQDASSISGNMDVVYEKASLVIRRHSMNIRGNEHNKWIDESYFLIARSHFFKRDYTLAILTFEYIIRQYDTPRAYDSKAWIAKSYHEQGRFDQARRMLDMLERNYSDGLLNEETTALFRKTFADHYLRQGNYQRAALELGKGMPYEKSAGEKARLTFIQAQLYHHSGEFANAQQAYQRVLDMRADRSMSFQARIGMAMAYDPEVGGGGHIRDELTDMLSEERYRSYRDQIYYALAQLAMRQNDQEEAIRLYRLSAEVSQENDMQKGLSFLRLGEIYFSHPDYLEAHLYYDSATTYLPAGYDSYEEIRTRTQVLSRISQLTNVIEREDSLQQLASLTEDQQLAVVEEIIADLREQERLRTEAERERTQEMRDAGRTARQARGTDQGRGWYFYNTTAMSNGEMEFFSRFGERPLEDMWRLSNRQVMADGFGMGMDGFDDLSYEDEVEEEFDEYDADAYLRNIPNSEEQLSSSLNRQMQAYYNLGLIFRDELRDRENAINSLETLIDRFPGSDRELNAYYHLYYLYRERGDGSQAERISNELIRRYPESEYAKIIGDPTYGDRMRQKDEYVRQLYRESYNAFFAGRFDIINRNREALDTLDASRELKARFAYLNAIALGKTDNRRDFISELQYVVDNYHDTPVHQPATTLLASLGSSAVAEPAVAREDRGAERIGRPADSPFDYSPDAGHFFLFLIDASEVDPTGITGYVGEFNSENYSDRDLSVSNIFFEGDKHLITITNFPDKENSMEYYNSLMGSEFISGNTGQGVEAFVISVDNYPLFYQEKEIEAYREFFSYYYMDF